MGNLVFTRAGIYTCIQDLGRRGYAKYGVPISGCMDHQSASLANLLVNNPMSFPVIEITLGGVEIHFHDQTLISLTGAELSASVAGNSLELNKTHTILANQTIIFSNPKCGMRAYLGIHGLEGEKIMGSFSQYDGITSKSRIESGDMLNYKTVPTHSTNPVAVHIDRDLFDTKMLEIYQGPDYALIDTEIIEHFITTEISIHENNRMGYHLHVKKPLENTYSIITSNVIPGTIQLTPSGQLLAMMRDAQVTGGYPRIFQLTQRSINQLAQKSTGSKFRFKLVDYHS